MATQGTASARHALEDQSEAIEYCYRMGWTDGLPVVPPTEGLISRFLEYVGREPSDVILVEPVAGRVVTAEKAAANAILAGCLPEHFPVVLAALDAMGEPAFNLHGATLNNGGSAIMAIVGGPIVEKLGMNSSFALFCPGNRANAAIGRALHLVPWNCTGNRPDQMDKTVFGFSGRYSMCIAERAEALPKGWQPLHVERGLPPGSSAVSVFVAMYPQQGGYSSSDPREILLSVADKMRFMPPWHRELLVVLSPEVLYHLGNAGWTKTDVREFLFQEARRLCREIRRGHGFMYSTPPPKDMDDEMIPILKSPEALNIVAGGGEGGPMAMIVPPYGLGIHAKLITRQIVES